MLHADADIKYVGGLFNFAIILESNKLVRILDSFNSFSLTNNGLKDVILFPQRFIIASKDSRLLGFI